MALDMIQRYLEGVWLKNHIGIEKEEVFSFGLKYACIIGATETVVFGFLYPNNLVELSGDEGFWIIIRVIINDDDFELPIHRNGLQNALDALR